VPHGNGLEVVDLWVKVENKEILKGVNLHVPKGELHVLMGPNGAGKSTLAMTLAGHPKYKVVRGDILLDGESIKDLPPEERARKGLAVLLQHPPELEGVKVAELLNKLIERYGSNTTPQELLERVGLSPSLLFRYFNVGFSGGERKRLELARILAMRPKIVVMDEPDSGVDVESLKYIAKNIEDMVKSNIGVLVITHYRNILRYVTPNRVHIMVDGRIVLSGGPELVEKIEKEGYSGVVKVA